MTRLAILAMSAALLGACGPSNPSTDESAAGSAPTASISGTSWTVATLEGRAPIDDAGGAPTIAFADGRVFGTTGCNRFTGGYTLGADGALRLGGEGGALASTRMACSPELEEQEAAMLRALEVVASHAIDADGRLALKNAAGETVLEATSDDAA